MRYVHKAFEEGWGNNKRARFIKTALDKEIVDKEGSIEWIRNGALKNDNERLLLAAQDNGFWTRTTMNMINPATDKSCRMCNEKSETTSHLMSGCQTLLALVTYTTRRNNICRLIHIKNLEHLNLPRASKFWEHEPKSITTSPEIDIYYDYPIPIARHIEGGCIKPDILIHNKVEKNG